MDTSSAAADLVRRDLAVLWHPCTQMKDHEDLPPVPIRRGRGAWLEGMDGRRYLDAISSWWVNLYGHTSPGEFAMANTDVVINVEDDRRNGRAAAAVALAAR